MCCEEDSIICDIIGALSACCFCYWWNVIPNEKPSEKKRRIKSVSESQNLDNVDMINENVVYAKQSQSKYILPVDFPSQHGKRSFASQHSETINQDFGNNSPKNQISDIYDNIGPLSNLNMKLAKSQMRSEKFDKINESPRQLAVKNSDNFVLMKDNRN